MLGGCFAATRRRSGGSRCRSRPRKPARRRRPCASISASSRPIAAPTTIRSSRPWSTQTVDKLVAASERPDQRYRVTILNSPAINAFALPSGQLYVTRGLIALANDTSELASVLSHEMAHVIAQHAAIREDRARQVALVTRVFDNLGSDPETSALALAKSKIALASFSRAQEFEADGIGVGIAARAGYDPYGAVRFLTSMGRNAELKPAAQAQHRSARARLPVVASGDAGARAQRPDQRPPVHRARRGERDRDGLSRRASTAWSTARTRARASCAAAASCIRKLGFTFVAPEGFTLDNTAQAVLGVKEGGGQALRLDVVRVPAEQPLTDYLTSGWIEGIDTQVGRGARHQRLHGGDRDRQGRPVVVPPLRGALRQRRLPLHLRDQAHDAGDRPHVPRIRSAASAA